MPGFLDFLTAAATGASTGLQANDQMQQREREQKIEEEERAQEQRLRELSIEKALMELDPQERFNVEGGVVTPQGGYRSREEAEDAAKGQRSMMRRDDLGGRNREVMQTERVAEARARGTAAGTPDRPQSVEPPRTITTGEGPAQWNAQTGAWEPVMVGGERATRPGGDDGGPVGETGRMAAALLPLAEDAYARIQALDTPGFREQLAGGGSGFLGMGNYFNTPAGRQFQQVSNQFLSSALAILSGKTVSEEELRRVQSVYIPQPGDDSATVTNKMRTMGLMAQSIRQMAGAAETTAPPDGNRNTVGGPADTSWQARARELRAQGMSPQDVLLTLRREGVVR